MRLWKKVEQESNAGKDYNDIDDFYLYMFDEEDLSNNQMTFNRKKRSGKFN